MGCVNELLVLLLGVGWGTLLRPYGYTDLPQLFAVFGGLKGFSGTEEDAQDRAVGPH